MQTLRHRDLDQLRRLHPALYAPAPAFVQLARGARTQEGIVPLGIVADYPRGGTGQTGREMDGRVWLGRSLYWVLRVSGRVMLPRADASSEALPSTA
jgi:hypothetical protein